VLSQCVTGDLADVGKRVSTERADRAGHGWCALKYFVHAPVEVEAGHVLDVLPAAEQTTAVADLRVSGNRTDSWIAERLHQPPQRLGLEDGVSVDHHDDGRRRGADAGVEGRGLAAVRLAEDANPLDRKPFDDLG